jgi:phosphoserine phosphatase SerB
MKKFRCKKVITDGKYSLGPDWEKCMSNYKLVLFDMDGTLLKKRTFFVFAEKYGFTNQLMMLLKSEKKPYEKTIAIASLLKGLKKEDLLDLFHRIPLQEDVESVLTNLHKRGIITAIASDSYQFAADDLKDRLAMNYAFANDLIIKDGIFTGDIAIRNSQLHEDNIDHQVYSICKSDVLEELCASLHLSLQEAIAVGDGIVDRGMLTRAGLGVAFNAPEKVLKHADIMISRMSTLLDFI